MMKIAVSLRTQGQIDGTILLSDYRHLKVVNPSIRLVSMTAPESEIMEIPLWTQNDLPSASLSGKLGRACTCCSLKMTSAFLEMKRCRRQVKRLSLSNSNKEQTVKNSSKSGTCVKGISTTVSPSRVIVLARIWKLGA